MLSIKQLILTVAVAFSVHSSNGHALEKSMAFPFALAVGKALITTPKPFIEVSSTKVNSYQRCKNGLITPQKNPKELYGDRFSICALKFLYMNPDFCTETL